MSEYGIRIKNIKAATLYGYNLGVRDRYDYTNAMFSNSLFSKFITKHGMHVHNKESTRDIICLEFDFGLRSYEEEIAHINKLLKKAADEDSIKKIEYLKSRIEKNKDLYEKKSKDEIREDFYENDVSIRYTTVDKKTGEIVADETITYRMLYRNASKAKMGQVMFINVDLYDKAYDWLTMGIGSKLPKENAKIVEMSAYAPLVTSTIVGDVKILARDILILKDQDSIFNTIADIVKAEEYEYEQNGETKTGKRCVVVRERTDVKNTLWDGMALIETNILPDWVNGMALLRNHFFKACAIRCRISEFLKEWCERNGKDYDTYLIPDMFGVKHPVRNIKMITTDNAIKWKKFQEFMGDGTLLGAYKYWCGRIQDDGNIFGIVKTDHPSKLGGVQQMSYQMVNTLPCNSLEVKEIAQTSIDYVDSMKKDNDKYEEYLRNNANEVNHYEMIADLYRHNKDISNTKWFKVEKSKIITSYVNRLRNGKITINADNLTIFGNPYALLLYSVGEDFNSDPTFSYEAGAIQCYTKRFEPGEYLAGFRNPHNSPNNVCYLHNVSSDVMDKYFELSKNIMIVNSIGTDVQDRCNGMDYDSDFMFVTNHATVVRAAKKCYKEYPTVVNKLKESGITYNNTKKEYARMDNKFARSQRYIGESSNLAQLAMTYYWTDREQHKEFSFRSKELYDNFVILAVLAQVVIDGCKREYEIDATVEIERIKRLPSMSIKKEVIKNGKVKYERCDFPKFMKYTKEVPLSRNGSDIPYDEVKSSREKITNRINETLVCPMNYLQDWLDKIQGVERSSNVDMKEYFIRHDGIANSGQVFRIRKIVEEYDNYVIHNLHRLNTEEGALDLVMKTKEVLEVMKKIKITNIITINRLVETCLGINEYRGPKKCEDPTKYTRKMLNLLYRMDKERFLQNFVEKP